MLWRACRRGRSSCGSRASCMRARAASSPCAAGLAKDAACASPRGSRAAATATAGAEAPCMAETVLRGSERWAWGTHTRPRPRRAWAFADLAKFIFCQMRSRFTLISYRLIRREHNVVHNGPRKRLYDGSYFKVGGMYLLPNTHMRGTFECSRCSLKLAGYSPM